MDTGRGIIVRISGCVTVLCFLQSLSLSSGFVSVSCVLCHRMSPVLLPASPCSLRHDQLLHALWPSSCGCFSFNHGVRLSSCDLSSSFLFSRKKVEKKKEKQELLEYISGTDRESLCDLHSLIVRSCVRDCKPLPVEREGHEREEGRGREKRKNRGEGKREKRKSVLESLRFI